MANTSGRTEIILKQTELRILFIAERLLEPVFSTHNEGGAIFKINELNKEQKLCVRNYLTELRVIT